MTGGWLMSDLWTYAENRIAVRYPYECDRPVAAADRKLLWPAPGPRLHDARFGLAVE
ncbi:MAG: hypothetical protein AB7O37_21910 [Vicinamibacteria bacterium]